MRKNIKQIKNSKLFKYLLEKELEGKCKKFNTFNAKIIISMCLIFKRMKEKNILKRGQIYDIMTEDERSIKNVYNNRR